MPKKPSHRSKFGLKLKTKRLNSEVPSIITETLTASEQSCKWTIYSNCFIANSSDELVEALEKHTSASPVRLESGRQYLFDPLLDQIYQRIRKNNLRMTKEDSLQNFAKSRTKMVSTPVFHKTIMERQATFERLEGSV